jgi:hypothetical protein
MKEPPQRQRPGTKPPRRTQPAEGAGEAEGAVLASIPEGPRDTRLGGDAAPPRIAGDAQPTSQAPARNQAARPSEREEALALPEGAWLAMRKSGGLLFSSREVVVYGDGRVAGSAIGGGRPERDSPPRRLAAAQLAALRRAVEQIDFGRLPAVAGRQGRDAFVYELVARSGRATHAVEVFEGAIPEQLAPLVEQLNRLLPRDEP